jgi:rifampicin phosphotransferase
MKFLRWDIPVSDRHENVGGKAANLFRLKDEGLNVPDFIVIPQDAGLEIIPGEILTEGNFDKIRQQISDYKFSAEFIDRLLANLKGKFFAVRSSAADEDSAAFSFAGQFETELFVTRETLKAAIKKVWLSAWSDRVRAYRLTNNIQSKAGIAVIIQEMIAADSAGVAFGINPATGNRNEKLVSAVWGLGEGLVSGALDADNYFVTGNNVRAETVAKTKKFIFNSNSGHGVTEENVSAELQNTRVLSDDQALQVSATLDKLKLLYGKPQDIEFAFRDNIFFLLQSRPVTTVGNLADEKGEYIVWDNSNIIESYPGLSSPLTFSFIRKMYEAVYIQFSAMMGINAAERKAHAETYANMLGLLKGRVYYNLRSWFKLLSLLPGYSLNAEFMEKMMGVKERFVLDDYVPRTKFRERMRVGKMIWLTLGNLRRLPEMRRRFTGEFEGVMTRFEKIDFNQCDSWRLMRLYKEFEQTLVERWKAPLVNDFFAMIYYGTLQKLVVKYKIDAQGTLHNDLLCGARDIISTEPIHRCAEIADAIKKDSEALKLFGEPDDVKVWKSLQEPQFQHILALFESYIRSWGDRTVGELKLETITYRQQPVYLVRVIRGFLTNTESQNKDFDMKLRAAAEEQVNKALSGKPFKKMLFNYFLRKSRDLVSNRENLRYARTRGFGMVRRIFTAIGNNFYAEGILDSPRDIFWLKMEEIFDFIQGTSETQNFKPLIGLRKNEYAEFEKTNTAERIPTRGIVYLGNDFTAAVSTVFFSDGKETLKGLGCCPGIVKAKVRIVHDPHSLSSLEGDILVTSSTDPGWVTLFPSASAILVERGSLLSHSAIVSREMGKPCIVGITGLLQKLKTGDVVEMNGATGQINILES